MKKPYTDPKIFAGGANLENWSRLTKEEKEAALAKDWYIRYSYIDENGKMKRMPNIKAGANRFDTKEERLDVLEPIRRSLHALLKEGFNPRNIEEFPVKNPNSVLWRQTGHKPIVSDGDVSSETPVIDALKDVYSRLDLAETTMKDLRQILSNFGKSVKALAMDDVPISKFTRSKIKKALLNLDLKPGQYNKHLTYLSILMSEALEMELISDNPIMGIRKKKTVKRIRETLSLDEFHQIAGYLHEHHYEFFRYAMIFFQSGARSSEMFRLRVKDVNLDRQEYKALILKGRQYNEQIKVILPGALHYWREVLSEAKSGNDYLFSKGLAPGEEQIREYQITKRWKRLVKDRLGFFEGKLAKLSDQPMARPVTADFYALKKLFLTTLNRAVNLDKRANFATTLASHTSEETTKRHYLSHEEDIREELKKVNIDVFKK